MKKIMNKVNFAALSVLVSMSAFAADETVGAATKAAKGLQANGVCELLKNLHSVFNTLRVLAFIGAAFYIAGWAWTYISKAGEKEGFSVEDIKKKGIGLLVGFTLLFVIGLVLSFVMSVSGMEIMGCAGNILRKW